MVAQGGQAKLSYVPQPHEQAYYDGLFAVADTHRTGSIGGQDAVRFLSLSGLPVDVLKPVWTLADQPPTNALDRQKFYVAVRLIQLLQNGQKGQGQNLAAPDGVALRPATFKGVSGASVPMPPADPAPGAAAGDQQQQQQQQPPPNQQQPTPTRPPHPAQQRAPPPAVQSTALTAQDPYTLTPSEQSRYEGLFPEYAKPDGYVYGAEAVALFGKSGLPQQQLAAIWNMVDMPVDNRLDKLEFAMIMHLIVCVSKKNLPMPPGLPMSLKQLKAQQQSVPSTPRLSAKPQPAASPVPSPSSIPPPATIKPIRQPQMQQQQPTMAGAPPIQRVPTNDSAATGMSSLPGPPPLQGGGGSADIHDAFEGLSTSGAGLTYNASQPMSPSQPPAMGYTSLDGSSRAMNSTSLPSPSQPIEPTPAPAPSAAVIPEPEAARQPAPAPSAPSPAEVKTTQQLKSSYDMGEASEELTKLKAVLQKLQAENISLKATMGSLTEEEKDVQKELNATVTEIGKLSNELTTLRAQVLAAKSRLLEATAELKACHEKKAVISDLIAEASATKEALDDAYIGIEQANEAARAQPAPAPAPLPAPSGSGSFDGDFFSFDAAPAPVTEPALPEPAPGATDVHQQSPEQQHDIHSYGAEPSHDVHRQQDAANATDAHFGHNRIDSTGSGYMEGEGIMGGAPAPLPSGTGPASMPLQNQHPSGGSASHDGGPPPSMESIAALKKKLKEAEGVARDAEESRRQVAAQADELRRLADEAEAKSREHAAIPEGGKKKGKGFLGRGKKKDAKEGERLAQDAKSKKDKLLEAQSQLNDSQALAVETKAEAEKLRKEVEEAEIKAASAASMQHSQPPPPQQQHQLQLQPTNGYPPQMDQDPWGAIPQKAAAAEGSGAFGQPLGGRLGEGGFNSAVMGSGGTSIPEIPGPSDSADPYSNPFAGV